MFSLKSGQRLISIRPPHSSVYHVSSLTSRQDKLHHRVKLNDIEVQSLVESKSINSFKCVKRFFSIGISPPTEELLNTSNSVHYSNHLHSTRAANTLLQKPLNNSSLKRISYKSSRPFSTNTYTDSHSPLSSGINSVESDPTRHTSLGVENGDSVSKSSDIDVILHNLHDTSSSLNDWILNTNYVRRPSPAPISALSQISISVADQPFNDLSDNDLRLVKFPSTVPLVDGLFVRWQTKVSEDGVNVSVDPRYVKETGVGMDEVSAQVSSVLHTLAHSHPHSPTKTHWLSAFHNPVLGPQINNTSSFTPTAITVYDNHNSKQTYTQQAHIISSSVLAPDAAAELHMVQWRDCLLPRVGYSYTYCSDSHNDALFVYDEHDELVVAVVFAKNTTVRKDDSRVAGFVKVVLPLSLSPDVKAKLPLPHIPPYKQVFKMVANSLAYVNSSSKVDEGSSSHASGNHVSNNATSFNLVRDFTTTAMTNAHTHALYKYAWEPLMSVTDPETNVETTYNTTHSIFTQKQPINLQLVDLPLLRRHVAPLFSNSSTTASPNTSVAFNNTLLCHTSHAVNNYHSQYNSSLLDKNLVGLSMPETAQLIPIPTHTVNTVLQMNELRRGSKNTDDLPFSLLYSLAWSSIPSAIFPVLNPNTDDLSSLLHYSSSVDRVECDAHQSSDDMVLSGWAATSFITDINVKNKLSGVGVLISESPGQHSNTFAENTVVAPDSVSKRITVVTYICKDCNPMYKLVNTYLVQNAACIPKFLSHDLDVDNFVTHTNPSNMLQISPKRRNKDISGKSLRNLPKLSGVNHDHLHRHDPLPSSSSSLSADGSSTGSSTQSFSLYVPPLSSLFSLYCADLNPLHIHSSLAAHTPIGHKLQESVDDLERQHQLSHPTSSATISHSPSHGAMLQYYLLHALPIEVKQQDKQTSIMKFNIDYLKPLPENVMLSVDLKLLKSNPDPHNRNTLDNDYSFVIRVVEYNAIATNAIATNAPQTGDKYRTEYVHTTPSLVAKGRIQLRHHKHTSLTQTTVSTTLLPPSVINTTLQPLRQLLPSVTAHVFGGQGGRKSQEKGLWDPLRSLPVLDEIDYIMNVTKDESAISADPFSNVNDSKKLPDKLRIRCPPINPVSLVTEASNSHFRNFFNLNLQTLVDHNPAFIAVKLTDTTVTSDSETFHVCTRLEWLKLLLSSAGIELELLQPNTIVFQDLTSSTLDTLVNIFDHSVDPPPPAYALPVSAASDHHRNLILQLLDSDETHLIIAAPGVNRMLVSKLLSQHCIDNHSRTHFTASASAFEKFDILNLFQASAGTDQMRSKTTDQTNTGSGHAGGVASVEHEAAKTDVEGVVNDSTTSSNSSSKSEISISESESKSESSISESSISENDYFNPYENDGLEHPDLQTLVDSIRMCPVTGMYWLPTDDTRAYVSGEKHLHEAIGSNGVLSLTQFQQLSVFVDEIASYWYSQHMRLASSVATHQHQQLNQNPLHLQHTASTLTPAALTRLSSLYPHLDDNKLIAGHSLGEFSAVAARTIDFDRLTGFKYITPTPRMSLTTWLDVIWMRGWCMNAATPRNFFNAQSIYKMIAVTPSRIPLLAQNIDEEIKTKIAFVKETNTTRAHADSYTSSAYLDLPPAPIPSHIHALITSLPKTIKNIKTEGNKYKLKLKKKTLSDQTSQTESLYPNSPNSPNSSNSSQSSQSQLLSNLDSALMKSLDGDGYAMFLSLLARLVTDYYLNSCSRIDAATVCLEVVNLNSYASQYTVVGNQILIECFSELLLDLATLPAPSSDSHVPTEFEWAAMVRAAVDSTVSHHTDPLIDGHYAGHARKTFARLLSAPLTPRARRRSTVVLPVPGIDTPFHSSLLSRSLFKSGVKEMSASKVSASSVWGVEMKEGLLLSCMSPSCLSVLHQHIHQHTQQVDKSLLHAALLPNTSPYPYDINAHSLSRMLSLQLASPVVWHSASHTIATHPTHTHSKLASHQSRMAQDPSVSTHSQDANVSYIIEHSPESVLTKMYDRIAGVVDEIVHMTDTTADSTKGLYFNEDNYVLLKCHDIENVPKN